MTDLWNKYNESVLNREPLEVYSHGKDIWQSERKKLSAAQEAELCGGLFDAATQVGDSELAKSVFTFLSETFPNSRRLARLSGLNVKPTDSKACDAAMTLALESVRKDRTSLPDRRMVLAVLKHHKSETKEFMSALKLHLQDMPLDIPSWRQLGEANLAIGSLKEARYCFEELALLLDPSNLYYLLTLADICYAQESYRASRKYFSLAVTFDPYSPRALWGFVLAYQKAGGSEKPAELLYDKVLQRLKALYHLGSPNSMTAATLEYIESLENLC